MTDLLGGLSQTEATERGQLLAVHSYEIELDLTGLAVGTEFTSHTTVRFSGAEPGASTWIDLIASQVTSIELNGHLLDAASLIQPGRLVLPDVEADNTLTIAACHQAATGRDIGRGLSRSVDASDGSVYAWTQCEAFDARRVFACFDQPDLKAPITLTVSTPSTWICTANGYAPHLQSDGAGLAPTASEPALTASTAHVWRFTTTPPVPTYVFAVCAGPFHVIETAHGGLPLRLFARRSLTQALDDNAPELFDLVTHGLDHFADLFGRPFAGDSYDHVFLPDFGGAMENFGCVCWTDDVIYRAEPTPLERQLRAIICFHEMAHMWFGDLVTMRWWDDLWLNEAFADWAGFGAADALLAPGEAWATFNLLKKRRAYRLDASPATHPIRGVVADVDHAEATVDMITYAKGASALRQLSSLVGTEIFADAVRRYIDRHAWANATLADFLTAVEEASGRDLSDWASDWLESEGTSVLAWQTDAAGTRVLADVTLGRRRERVTSVGTYETDGPTLRPRERTRLTFARGGVAVAGEFALANDDDTDFVRIAVDDGARDLLGRAGALTDPLARAVALGTLDDEVFRGEAGSEGALRAVAGCLLTETRGVQLQLLATLGEELATLWTPPARRAAALAELADAAATRAASAGAGEASAEPRSRAAASLREVRRVAQRALVRLAVTPVQVAAVADLFAGASDQALRWACLERLVATGRAGVEELLREASGDGDPDAEATVRMLATAAPTSSAKRDGLELMFGAAPLSQAQRRRLSTVFWQPDQSELLSDTVIDYVQRLEEVGTEGRLDALFVGVQELPTAHAWPVRQRLATLAGRAGLPPRVATGLAVQLDLLDRASRAHAHDH